MKRSESSANQLCYLTSFSYKTTFSMIDFFHTSGEKYLSEHRKIHKKQQTIYHKYSAIPFLATFHKGVHLLLVLNMKDE
jgi:hypothetical protein